MKKSILVLIILLPLLFSCGEKKKEKFKINFSEISGKWEGTYTGDEEGIFQVYISDNGSILSKASFGFITDGRVYQNGYIKISIGKVSTGAIFEGNYKNNRFIGTWINSHYNLRGTFIAEKIKDQVLPNNDPIKIPTH